ncbi:MAG TPA: hemolysin family protein, partial [Armatimonadota bacterium]|nr:hemolysin family protein [Armatimonadota bacterium]
DFLATVQVWISFISIFTGAFGGASFVRVLEPKLVALGVSTRYAHTILFALVVLAITYFSLVLGELVPKRLALINADRLALFFARPMRQLARLVHPLVSLLSFSTDAVLHLLGSREHREPIVATEEIGYLLETGMRHGEIQPVEAGLVQEAFRFTDTRARDAMTPRPDIIALSDTAVMDEVLQTVLTSGYTRIPIYHDSIDNVIGFIHARDLLKAQTRGETLPLADLMRQPIFVPESITLDALLSRFRQERTHLAIVLDEFGATAGMITLEDVLEELVGEIHGELRVEEGPILKRTANTWLVDGTVSLDDLRDVIPIEEWPERAHLGYSTLAGFLLARLGHIPTRGESTEWQGYCFEIVDMDGRRIDQVLITRLPDLTSEANKE